ncbi:MAG: hypothetical protein PHV17_02700 [Candidatus Omnitrophica bacterium]|nr:hypothetical protein [Candidatus Omnitrophota bacterium]
MASPLKAFFSGLSAKEKKVLYLALVFVSIAILDSLIVRPMNRVGENIEHDIDNQKILIQNDLLILQHKEKIIKEYKAYSIFLTDRGMDESELKAQFLGEVEQISKAAKIGITPGTVTSEEVSGFIQYSLTIECLGKMRDVINFIYGIESSNKPLQVVAIQIAPKNRQDYEVKCSLTVVKYLVEPDEEL